MEEVDEIVRTARRLKFSPETSAKGHHYASLPLCLIDAVFSIGVRYSGVVETIDRFANLHDWKVTGRDRYSGGPGEHGIRDFLRLYDRFPEPESAARELFGNRQRTSARSGILKAEACRLFANALLRSDINDFPDINDDRLSLAEARVLMIPGQGSGLSFDYFRLLAGDDTMVKPDRMVVRFIARTLGINRDNISPRFASALIKLAAKKLAERDHHWTPMKLDYQIWKFESRSPDAAT